MLRTWLRSYVRVNVLRRGLSGNSRLWMVVGAAIGLRRLSRRFGGTQPSRVFGEPLAPGERLVITHVGDPMTRRQAKRYRRKASEALAAPEPQ